MSISRVTRITPQCGGMSGWLGHAIVVSLVALVVVGASITRANASIRSPVQPQRISVPFYSGTLANSKHYSFHERDALRRDEAHVLLAASQAWIACFLVTPQ
jgi:hypothetical protein